MLSALMNWEMASERREREEQNDRVFFLSFFLSQRIGIIHPLIDISSLTDYFPVILTFTINDNRRLSIDQDINNVEPYNHGRG